MASRVVLQRASNRGALRISPRGPVSPSTLNLLNNYSTGNGNNGIPNAINTLANYSIRTADNTRARTKPSMSITRTSRLFSTSASRTKELSKMSEEEVSGLRVKEDRLMRDLHETCEWGKGERWGR